MNYNEAIQYLYDRLPVFHQIGAAAYKPGLENSIRMMNQLGNPQTDYKTIHVAGTNGKGSVSHFLSAVLQSAGYRVGLYTSPHLVDFRERIRVNGKKIDGEYVVEFVKKNEAYFDEIQPSFFEATMAMAFQYFSDMKVDIAVIEVGLGGRLDSTNIIHPLLSVITNIGFDHTEFLGNTWEKIAAEKAGIIKLQTPVVIGETNQQTRAVFVEKATSENVSIAFAEEKHPLGFSRNESGEMTVTDAEYGKLLVGLNGNYQLKNVATVLTGLDELKKQGFVISDEQVRTGLSEVVKLTGMQGRWQVMQHHPTVVLDTGHNKEGVEYIANQLKQQKYDRLHIVIGMVSDKDVSGVLSLLPEKAVYYFTAAQTQRALPPAELQLQATGFNLHGKAFDTVEHAVEAALKNAQKEDFIFIGGSNFIVGEALSVLGKR